MRQMLTYSRKTEQEKKPLRLSSIVKETVEFFGHPHRRLISIRVNVLSESALILGRPYPGAAGPYEPLHQRRLCHAGEGRVLDIDLTDFSVSPSGRPYGMKPGLYVRLTVRDTGTGMSPDIMDKIFDPFFTTKKLGEGTGLGLSVVHGIVKQHDGYITVESEPGKGSVFTVYFPEIAGEPETDAVSDDEIPTGSERILFVDDEEALVEMGEDILAELGYEVTSRMNGKEALALFKLDPPGSILSLPTRLCPK